MKYFLNLIFISLTLTQISCDKKPTVIDPKTDSGDQSTSAPTTSLPLDPRFTSDQNERNTIHCDVLSTRAGEKVGCDSQSCQVYSVPSGQELGCTSAGCRLYPLHENEVLGCTATECRAHRLEQNQAVGCTREECRIYPLRLGEQIGCTNRQCDVFFTGYFKKIECNADECKTVPAPYGAAVGCTANTCKSVVPKSNLKLICDRTHCEEWTVPPGYKHGCVLDRDEEWYSIQNNIRNYPELNTTDNAASVQLTLALSSDQLTSHNPASNETELYDQIFADLDQMPALEDRGRIAAHFRYLKSLFDHRHSLLEKANSVRSAGPTRAREMWHSPLAQEDPLTRKWNTDYIEGAFHLENNREYSKTASDPNMVQSLNLIHNTWIRSYLMAKRDRMLPYFFDAIRGLLSGTCINGRTESLTINFVNIQENENDLFHSIHPANVLESSKQAYWNKVGVLLQIEQNLMNRPIDENIVRDALGTRVGTRFEGKVLENDFITKGLQHLEASYLF